MRVTRDALRVRHGRPSGRPGQGCPGDAAGVGGQGSERGDRSSRRLSLSLGSGQASPGWQDRAVQMIRVPTKVLLCVGAILAGGALAPVTHMATAQTGCVPVAISDDTSNATNAFGPFLGTAMGQGF